MTSGEHAKRLQEGGDHFANSEALANITAPLANNAVPVLRKACLPPAPHLNRVDDRATERWPPWCRPDVDCATLVHAATQGTPSAIVSATGRWYKCSSPETPPRLSKRGWPSSDMRPLSPAAAAARVLSAGLASSCFWQKNPHVAHGVAPRGERADKRARPPCSSWCSSGCRRARSKRPAQSPGFEKSSPPTARNFHRTPPRRSRALQTKRMACRPSSCRQRT